MYKRVQIVGDDTDTFLCLLYQLNQDIDIIMRTKRDCQYRKNLRISAKISHRLPSFCTGCDTTSSFYDIGKLKVSKKSKRIREVLQQRIQIFGEDNVSQEQLSEAGKQFEYAMYRGGISFVNSLDKLKFICFKSPRYAPVERMPPTRRSCFFYSLRIHLKVKTWKNLETKATCRNIWLPSSSRYHRTNSDWYSVVHDKLLRDIRCSCQKRIDCAQPASSIANTGPLV